jgi:UDP-2,3-diacylglucosamine pyrophosphatase LpxH
MVLPDLHIPHHDPHALACVLEAHAMLKPKRTVILGDWLDCEAFSSHQVSSRAEERAQTFNEGEIQPCRRLLAKLEENTDEVIYIEGNHEFRVERTVVREGGVLLDLADLVSPRRLLSEGRGKPFTYVAYTQKPGQPLPHYKIAKDLIAIHGWSFAKHAAAKHLDIARTVSVVHGHTHRRQSFELPEPLTGRTLVAWSPGCLARKQPLYMAHTPTEWAHGFSLVWVNQERDDWTEYSPRIKGKGVVLPDGRKVSGRDYRKVVRAIEEGPA